MSCARRMGRSWPWRRLRVARSSFASRSSTSQTSHADLGVAEVFQDRQPVVSVQDLVLGRVVGVRADDHVGIAPGPLDVGPELLLEVVRHHVRVQGMGHEVVQGDHPRADALLRGRLGHAALLPVGRGLLVSALEAPNTRRFRSQRAQVWISHRFASRYSQPEQSRHLSFTAVGYLPSPACSAARRYRSRYLGGQ